VESEGVDHRLAAIISADAVGYSRLLAADERETVRRLNAYRDAMGALIQEHRGRVVDAPGDNLLAEFASATAAVSCAVEIQRDLLQRNAELSADRKLEFRLGVHLGEVLVEGDRIYGDGVNVAARMEGLAEPGGICISDIIYRQVRNKLALAYQDLGDQSVKNIPDPIRVYRIRLESPEAVTAHDLPGMDELTVPGFSSRPAIAVLPFENLSGDPEQEYFADGIAEDLITRLSTFRSFPVIARNSSFIYKGRAADVKEVGRGLGVRYVVEGSVRKVRERVRLSAQLIDATTGHHLWAERYDRDLGDIFAVQDEIIASIAASMYPELEQSERERAIRGGPENLDAWDLAQRGLWHFNKLTKEDNAKARDFLTKAVRMDQRLGLALCGLAVTYWSDFIYGWSPPDQVAAEIGQLAQRTAELDVRDPFAQLALAVVYRFSGQREKTIPAAQRAVELNPSFAFAYLSLGLVLGFAGRADEAIVVLDKAIRLSPHDPLMWLLMHGLSVAHFAAGRHRQAVEWAQRSIERRPDFTPPYRFLAASYAHLGQLDEAQAAVEVAERVAPGLTIATVRGLIAILDPPFGDHLVDGLRKAGLPEE
jgi:adenylate cyclase